MEDIVWLFIIVGFPVVILLATLFALAVVGMGFIIGGIMKKIGGGASNG